jgi:hypothetical protein
MVGAQALPYSGPSIGATSSKSGEEDQLNFSMRSLRRRQWRLEKRGQGTVEFALAIPTIFILLFGIFEFGLLFFDLGTTNYAANEAARVAAQAGNGTTSCAALPGCAALFPPPIPPAVPPPCDGDCQALVAINQTQLGGTSLEQITSIHFRLLNTDGSTCPAGGCKENIWTFPNDGVNPPKLQPCPSAGCYDYSSRNTTYGKMDYLQVEIDFTYNWKTGLFEKFDHPKLSATYTVRIEPQKF